MSVQAVPRPRQIGTAPAITAQYVGLAALALLLAALHIKHRPASMCVLRSVTGIPCPFCGGTTAAVDLGHGEVGAALRASPLAVSWFAIGPALRTIKHAHWWASSRVRWALVLGVLVVSELWELGRFGIISV